MDKDSRSTLIEFWQTFLAMILALILMIVGIYVTQAYAHYQEQKRLEMLAAQKELDRQNRASEIKIYAFVNTWEINYRTEPPSKSAYMERNVELLEPGVEYEIGQRNCYDRNDEYGFDKSMPDTSDDPEYFDPIFTFSYSGYLHIYSSMDGEGGWMVGGATTSNPKTGVCNYYSENYESADDFLICTDSLYSVKVPINGKNNLVFDRTSTDVSDKMRYYNEVYEERLGDVYENVPEEYADRTRTVYVSYVIIESWISDPCEWNSPNTARSPEATVKLCIRHYGAFDVTAEEYDSMIIDVPIFSNIDHREFSPRTTVELIY